MDDVDQVHIDAAIKGLQSAKESLVALARGKGDLAQIPNVMRALGHTHTHIDEAYQWIVVGMSAALDQSSEANVEKVVAKAQAEGNLKVAPDEEVPAEETS